MGVRSVLRSEYFAELEWERADVIFQNNYSVCDDGIYPVDIVQKTLGDCYLIATICAISERQDRVKRLLITQNKSPSGIYCVALCIHGTWEYVIMDDYFSIDPLGGYRPAFSCSKDNQMWVMLLLKAWAKVYGGFLNVCGGTTLETLAELTGAPTAHFDTQINNEEFHWANLYKATKAGYVLCSSSKTKENGVELNGTDPESGIVYCHA